MQTQRRYVISICRCMVWINFGQKKRHGFRHAAQRFLSQADLRNQQVARLLILDKLPDRSGNQMVLSLIHICYRCAKLPANLLQAQRDYFGAHTYLLEDDQEAGPRHTNWTGEGGEISSGVYNV